MEVNYASSAFFKLTLNICYIFIFYIKHRSTPEFWIQLLVQTIIAHNMKLEKYVSLFFLVINPE